MLIQKPETSWYEEVKHEATSYEIMKKHSFEEGRLLAALEDLAKALLPENNEKQVIALYQAILEETNSLGMAMVLFDIAYNEDIQNKHIAEKRMKLTEQYHRLMDQVYPALKDALSSSYVAALEAEILKVTTREEIEKIKNYQTKSEEELSFLSREHELVQQYNLTMQQKFEVEVNGEKWTAEKLQTNPPSDVAQNYQINNTL